MKYDQYKKDFVRKVQRMSGKYSPRDIFNDFCHMARLALANIFHDPKLDAEYNTILSRHDGDVKPFSELLAIAVDAYESKIGDFLGECYEELGIQNQHAGQFFTPYSVSRTMAEITITPESVKSQVADHGYFSIGDEACGAGSTLLAALDVLKNRHNINFQRHCLVVAQDIDDNCAAMCFVQLALLGAPAVVTTGNTLAPNPRSGRKWYTMFYWMNAHKFRGAYPKTDKPILDTCKVALALESPPEPKIDVKIEASGQMAFNF